MDICQGNIPFDCVELVAPLSQPARSVSGGSKSVCFSPMFTCDIMLYRGCTVRMADTFSLVVLNVHEKRYPNYSILLVAKVDFWAVKAQTISYWSWRTWWSSNVLCLCKFQNVGIHLGHLLLLLLAFDYYLSPRGILVQMVDVWDLSLKYSELYT